MWKSFEKAAKNAAREVGSAANRVAESETFMQVTERVAEKAEKVTRKAEIVTGKVAGDLKARLGGSSHHRRRRRNDDDDDDDDEENMGASFSVIDEEEEADPSSAFFNGSTATTDAASPSKSPPSSSSPSSSSSEIITWTDGSTSRCPPHMRVYGKDADIEKEDDEAEAAAAAAAAVAAAVSKSGLALVVRDGASPSSKSKNDERAGLPAYLVARDDDEKVGSGASKSNDDEQRVGLPAYLVAREEEAPPAKTAEPSDSNSNNDNEEQRVRFPILIVPGMASSALRIVESGLDAKKHNGRRLWMDAAFLASSMMDDTVVGKSFVDPDRCRSSRKTNPYVNANGGGVGESGRTTAIVSEEKEEAFYDASADASSSASSSSDAFGKREDELEIRSAWLYHTALDANMVDERKGNKVRTYEGLDACEYLTDQALAKSAAVVWGNAVRYLEESLGYRRGIDLDAAPYDWRLPPSCTESRDGYLTETIKKIEDLYRNGGDRPVVLVCHSMGCRMGHYLLNHCLREKGRDWIDRHVRSYMPVGAPHTGAPLTLKLGATGAGLLGFVVDDALLSEEEGLILYRSWGSGPWLMSRDLPRGVLPQCIVRREGELGISVRSTMDLFGLFADRIKPPKELRLTIVFRGKIRASTDYAPLVPDSETDPTSMVVSFDETFYLAVPHLGNDDDDHDDHDDLGSLVFYLEEPSGRLYKNHSSKLRNQFQSCTRWARGLKKGATRLIRDIAKRMDVPARVAVCDRPLRLKASSFVKRSSSTDDDDDDSSPPVVVESVVSFRRCSGGADAQKILKHSEHRNDEHHHHEDDDDEHERDDEEEEEEDDDDIEIFDSAVGPPSSSERDGEGGKEAASDEEEEDDDDIEIFDDLPPSERDGEGGKEAATADTVVCDLVVRAKYTPARDFSAEAGNFSNDFAVVHPDTPAPNVRSRRRSFNTVHHSRIIYDGWSGRDLLERDGFCDTFFDVDSEYYANDRLGPNTTSATEPPPVNVVRSIYGINVPTEVSAVYRKVPVVHIGDGKADRRYKIDKSAAFAKKKTSTTAKKSDGGGAEGDDDDGRSPAEEAFDPEGYKMRDGIIQETPLCLQVVPGVTSTATATTTTTANAVVKRRVCGDGTVPYRSLVHSLTWRDTIPVVTADELEGAVHRPILSDRRFHALLRRYCTTTTTTTLAAAKNGGDDE